MKRRSVILLSFVALLFAFGLTLYYVGRPPSENKLLKGFYHSRASFEQIRDMLQTDNRVLSVSERGITTRDGTSKPPFGAVSTERYSKYLELLRDVGAIEAARWGTDLSELRLAIVMWASGFAGSTVHIGVCWTDHPPARQVSSLDAFFQNPTMTVGHGWVYRHIDSNWYLWTDRQTER
jgi:hypothetical protein